jgi:hypothetical protein
MVIAVYNALILILALNVKIQVFLLLVNDVLFNAHKLIILILQKVYAINYVHKELIQMIMYINVLLVFILARHVVLLQNVSLA